MMNDGVSSKETQLGLPIVAALAGIFILVLVGDLQSYRL